MKWSCICSCAFLFVASWCFPASAQPIPTLTKGGAPLKTTIAPGRTIIVDVQVPARQPATLVISSDGLADLNIQLQAFNTRGVGGTGIFTAKSYTFNFAAGPGIPPYRVFIADYKGPRVSPIIVQLK